MSVSLSPGKHFQVEQQDNPSKRSFLGLPAEIRQHILLFNCPISVSLLGNTDPNIPSKVKDEETKHPVYQLNAELVLVKNPKAKADFEHQIRMAADSVTLRKDMLYVIENRERQLDNLDSKVQSVLDHDAECNEWTGALYRHWLRDERLLQQYVYYCFRTGHPLVSELRNASYELIKLKRNVTQRYMLSGATSFGIPFTPDGIAARLEPSGIKSRKRKLSNTPPGPPNLLKDSMPNYLRYFPKHTVHFHGLRGKRPNLPNGPIDEIENGMLFTSPDQGRQLLDI